MGLKSLVALENYRRTGLQPWVTSEDGTVVAEIEAFTLALLQCLLQKLHSLNRDVILVRFHFPPD